MPESSDSSVTLADEVEDAPDALPTSLPRRLYYVEANKLVESREEEAYLRTKHDVTLEEVLDDEGAWFGCRIFSPLVDECLLMLLLLLVLQFPIQEAHLTHEELCPVTSGLKSRVAFFDSTVYQQLRSSLSSYVFCFPSNHSKSTQGICFVQFADF